MTTIRTVMTLKEWGMIIILSFLWGLSFFFAQVALKELPPLVIAFGRYFLAALSLWPFLLLKRERLPLHLRAVYIFFGMGLLNNAIPQFLIISAQQYINSSLASILNATTPFFTVILAHFFTQDEKMTWNKLAGVLTGFFGVVVLIGFKALNLQDTGIWALFMGLLAAFSYGVSGIFGRQIKSLAISSLTMATAQTTASSLIILPFLLGFVDFSSLNPSAQSFYAVLGLALLSTSLAYLFFFRILNSAGATNIMLVTFLIPFSAILLGVLILGETLLMRHLLGLALIGLGLLFIDGRLIKLRRG